MHTWKHSRIRKVMQKDQEGKTSEKLLLSLKFKQLQKKSDETSTVSTSYTTEDLAQQQPSQTKIFDTSLAGLILGMSHLSGFEKKYWKKSSWFQRNQTSPIQSLHLPKINKYRLLCKNNVAYCEPQTSYHLSMLLIGVQILCLLFLFLEI